MLTISVERFFASLKQLDQDSKLLHQDIIQKDLNVSDYTKIADKEILDDSSAHLGLMSESMDRIKVIIAEMQRPMVDMASKLSEIHDGLKSKHSKSFCKYQIVKMRDITMLQCLARGGINSNKMVFSRRVFQDLILNFL